MKAKKILAMVLCVAMVLSTMGFTVLAEDTDIIEVGADKTYETWLAAIAAATDADSDGVITYHVYGKVLMDSHNVKGTAATINIIGMTDDAELSVETANPTDNGIVYVSDNTIETVNFSNLKLSRPNGEYKVNEGHHNRFFTVWDSDGSTDLITYTNCVFPNGSGNNQYGKTTYTNCTFNNDVYYALWIYGSGNKGVVEVAGCTFDAARGVKIYSEDTSATVSTTIADSTFAIDSKPAIVSSIAGELVVEDVDATECEYGLLASEPKDGRADLESAAITVDGEEPVFVAKVGNMVCTDMDYAQSEANSKNNDSDPNNDVTVEIPVAKIGTKYYTTLQAAIDAAVASNTENIVVELLNDAVLDITAWDTLAIGGENTKSITINGNDKTLTFNKKNSDWNHIATNNDAKLILNDMTITDSGYNNGPWNRYDLNFACDVELNDVTATKALAFKSDATLKNVKINEVGDNYAIWITSGGQNVTIDGLEITSAGRGIKIDEQYQDAPSKVELSVKNATFATEKKAAILVKSAAGADVEVENVDITNVKADNVNAVWVDSDSSVHYGKVTVTGANVAVEGAEDFVALVASQGKVEGYYATLQEAINAATDGDTIKIASGRYDGFDILVDNVTITGMTADAEITINSIPGNAFIGVNAEGVLVEGLKFIIPEDCQRTGDYLDGFDAVIGYWSDNFNAGSNVTTGYDVKNCHFVNEHSGIGVAMFNFNSFEITGNTFENFNVGIHTMSDGSAMGEVVISGNTFTSVNEPVNVYWGQTGNDDDSIAITGNNFVSAKDADEIKITVHDYASTVTGTSGIDAIDLSGNTYSAATEIVLVDAASDVSSSVENALENVENVVVDTKYAAVARIGADKYFNSIEAALGAANPGDAIDLLGNNVTIDKAYVLNNDITFKNGMMLFDNYNGLNPGVYDPAGPNYAVMTIGANVTFDNVILTGENAVAQQGIFVLGTNGVMSLTNGSELNVTVPTATAVIYSEGTGKLVVNDSKINIDGNGNAVRGMLAVEIDADNAEITIENITDNAMRNVNGTVDNSTITVDGAEYGIKNDGACAALAVANSKIKVTNTTNESDNAGIHLTGRDKLVDTNSTIDATIFIDVVEGEDVVLNTLSFETNGGNAIPSVVRNQGEVVDLSGYKPEKSGYTFVGWYSDEALTQSVTTVTLDSPVTVYAKWNQNVTGGGSGGVARYTVVFVTNGGTSIDKISNLKNRTVDLAEYTTEKEGYTFEGWYTDKELTNKVTSVKLTDDITLYAKWVEIETQPGTDEPGTTEGGNLFADVKTTDWFYENVKYAVENELMNGVDEDKFAPNDTLTRAMLVTVLYRLDGEPVVENASFTDVDADAYYANAVSWAKQNGIVNGVTENEFAPNSDITREQIAAILYRYAQFKGFDVSVGENTDISSYADAESVSEYAAASIQYAVGSGLIKGKSATTLNPLDNATRAEIAAILQRFIEGSNN